MTQDNVVKLIQSAEFSTRSPKFCARARVRCWRRPLRLRSQPSSAATLIRARASERYGVLS